MNGGVPFYDRSRPGSNRPGCLCGAPLALLVLIPQGRPGESFAEYLLHGPAPPLLVFHPSLFAVPLPLLFFSVFNHEIPSGFPRTVMCLMGISCFWLRILAFPPGRLVLNIPPIGCKCGAFSFLIAVRSFDLCSPPSSVLLSYG